MAKKKRYLFLYLTLICFFGLIAVFMVDGYMGIYETIQVTSGEWTRTIEADYWLRDDSNWSVGINQDEKAFFRYEVDNRLFSSYTTDVEVSVWRSQEKVRDLLSQPLSIGGFSRGEVGWTINPADFFPADLPPEQGYQFTIVIKRGTAERNIIVHVNRVIAIPKPPTPLPAP